MVAPLVRPIPAPQHPALSWHLDDHGFLHIIVAAKTGVAGAKEDRTDRVFLSPDDTERLVEFLRKTESVRANAWRRQA